MSVAALQTTEPLNLGNKKTSSNYGILFKYVLNSLTKNSKQNLSC